MGQALSTEATFDEQQIDVELLMLYCQGSLTAVINVFAIRCKCEKSMTSQKLRKERVGTSLLKMSFVGVRIVHTN